MGTARHRLAGLLLVLGLLAPRLSVATTYTFLTLDAPYPGVSNTAITGVNMAGTGVGLYLDAGTRDQGFRWPLGQPVQVLLNVIPQAINRSGHIVGSYITDQVHGFVYYGGTFTPIDVPTDEEPPTILTEALGINDAGHIVGNYRDAVDRLFHGFLYTPATQTFRTFDAPGSPWTSLQAINNWGSIVGFFLDSAEHTHALRIDNGQLAEVVVPGVGEPMLVGITDTGLVAGSGVEPPVGFILLGGVVQVVEVPNSTLTELFGIRNDGTIYGRYIDTHGVDHGFLAVPDQMPPVASRGQSVRRPVSASAPCLPGSKRWACRAALHQ